MGDIVALRCYVEHKYEREPNHQKTNDNDKYIHKGERNFKHAASDSMVLVLDAETTADEHQNLLFGSCGIWVNGRRWKFFLFHADDLPKDKVSIIEEQARMINATVMSRMDFVEQIFFQYAYHVRAKCVGFNLKFDLSRWATYFGEAKVSKFKSGFSIKLSEYPVRPRIRVKSLNTKAAFTEFAPPLKSRKSERKNHFRGCFIDLRTTVFALTNQAHTLEGALKAFGCQLCKLSPEEHGKVTPEYVQYNINDTLSTYKLYTKVNAAYEHYNLDKGLNELYSPASLGKAYLDKIGIRPFSEKNPTFPKMILGHLMTAFFAGRTEARIRKKPDRVTYLDFASMYPSVHSLLDMDAFLKADKIVHYNTTKQTRKLLARVQLEDIVDKNLWSRLHTICRVKPDNDILPLRSLYGNKNTYNIGLNYITAADNTTLWYTLADVIASKLLTGKAPEILEAITFYPQGRQQHLYSTNIVGGIVVKPEDDFIRKLIIERFRLKKEAKSQSGKKRTEAEQLQTDLKIIANSISYGIYVELNTEEGNEETWVHGLHSFEATANRIESQGRAFNPIIGALIPAGARLILAAVEALIEKNDGQFVYCDTDGIFVSPQHARLVQNFFRPLNPFDIGGDVFKIEDDDCRQPLDNVWLYAISSKRYVLYDRDENTGQIKIRKYSSHGLGHLQGIDEEQWWQDVLRLHYHPEDKDKILDKYRGRFAVSKLAINDYATLSRFKRYNKSKPLSRQIKPFNFVTVGVGYRINTETGKPIIPMLPFVSPKSKRFQDVPYMPFIDYKSGKLYNEDAEFYWQPLSERFEQFVNHPEAKFAGSIGELMRKHLRFTKQSIRYIGKETNELEESQVLGAGIGNYTEYVEKPMQFEDIPRWKEILLNAHPKDVKPFGITGNQLWYIKRTILRGNYKSLQPRTIQRLIRFLCSWAKNSDEPVASSS